MSAKTAIWGIIHAFQVLNFPKVRYVHLSVAYLLSNNCTENHWNQTTSVKAITEG